MSDTGGITLVEILRQRQGVLLDFDGPVTVLFPDGSSRQLADAMRAHLGGVPLPPTIQNTRDPLAILRWAYDKSPTELTQLETICTAGEVAAASKTPLTPGIEEALHALAEHGYPVAIVSNNSPAAVSTSLELHGVAEYVATICARPPGRPDLMKPNPHLVTEAASRLRIEPGELILLGDSVTDVEVSRRTGVCPIGWGKTPTRALELRSAGARIVLESPGALGAALRT